MTGLIEDIQRDALDRRASLDNLLRRVKLAAAKLQLQTLGDWVEHELNGYTGDCPTYRIVVGQPVAWNPYNGWIPIQSDLASFMNHLSEVAIRQSIASLEDILDSESGGGLYLPMPNEVVSELNKILTFQTAKMATRISRGHVVNIIAAVRNKVLDWAIEMERIGVMGEGLTFAPQEKQQAQAAMNTFNIGSIANFAGNLGVGNEGGNAQNNITSFHSIAEAANKIKEAIPALVKEGVDGEKLEKIVNDLAVQSSDNSPDPGIIKKLLKDAHSILIGASGSLTASGAIVLIQNAISWLGA